MLQLHHAAARSEHNPQRTITVIVPPVLCMRHPLLLCCISNDTQHHLRLQDADLAPTKQHVHRWADVQTEYCAICLAWRTIHVSHHVPHHVAKLAQHLRYQLILWPITLRGACRGAAELLRCTHARLRTRTRGAPPLRCSLRQLLISVLMTGQCGAAAAAAPTLAARRRATQPPCLQG